LPLYRDGSAFAGGCRCCCSGAGLRAPGREKFVVGGVTDTDEERGGYDGYDWYDGFETLRFPAKAPPPVSCKTADGIGDKSFVGTGGGEGIGETVEVF
jgi:hypothetical protein